MGKITYENKVAINENAEIPNINKVTDSDMNEIKTVVNNNDDIVTNATTYSTTETVVGTWTDNKPIYRKVIDLGQIQVTTSEKKYDINITNSDKIISLDIMMKFANGTIWYRNWHIEELAYRKSDNSLSLIGNQTATFEKGYVVIEYTKND